MRKLKTPKHSETSDKRNAARHEAGHWVVAHHYGVARRASIWKVGKATKAKIAWIGQVNRDETTPFRKAVIAWAGIVAERNIHTLGSDGMAHLKRNFDAFFEFEQNGMSERDHRDILEHPNIWRTFETATRLLRDKAAELKTVAETLEEREGIDIGEIDPLHGLPKKMRAMILAQKQKISADSKVA